MKKFCVDLRKHATEIINCEKKEMLPLTDKKIESYNNKKFCDICKKKFFNIDDSDNDSNDDNNDDSIDEKLDVRKFHGDASGVDDVDDNYHDHDDDTNDKEFNIC